MLRLVVLELKAGIEYKKEGRESDDLEQGGEGVFAK